MTGASVLGFYMSTFVLVVETVGPQYKAIVGVLAGVPYAVGLLLFTLVSESRKRCMNIIVHISTVELYVPSVNAG